MLSATVLCCLHVGMSTSALRALTSALHPSSHLILLISWFFPPNDAIFDQGGWLWLCRAEDVLTFESPAKKVCSDWSSTSRNHVPEPAAAGEVLHGAGAALHARRADLLPGEWVRGIPCMTYATDSTGLTFSSVVDGFTIVNFHKFS